MVAIVSRSSSPFDVLRVRRLGRRVAAIRVDAQLAQQPRTGMPRSRITRFVSLNRILAE